MLTIDMLRRFLDSLEEGVLFLDKDRKVLTVNRAAREMIRLDDTSLVDLLCPAVFRETPCAQACEARGSCTLADGGTGGHMVQDIVLERPDKVSLYLRMWSILLPPAENVPMHYAIILRDRSHEVELEQEVAERLQLGSMVGHGAAMQKLYSQILRMAPSHASVLLTGESGTGKELVAKALHDNSDRSNGPYVPVHCAALPENLLESELFGHGRGAFTGAASTRIGRFEAACGGTLLLDEVGEIPLGTQVKLLRVLQEKEVVRLGENVARPVNVRVIAATHRNLAAMVERGEFREDLYYRLRVLPLHVPALRERKEDISLLANKLLGDLARQYARETMRLAHETLIALEAYDWPGNIRQLFNALEYALVHADGPILLPHHLPPEIGSVTVSPSATDAPEPLARPYYRPRQGDEGEAEAIRRALAASGGNKAEAARRLGMSRTTLWKRLKRRAA
ncbi:MAG TPA: sigma 54-interacting transcriptional regulator [Thiobacillaceae bacterium]|nr:sigma 54-interacting transcriptional regulator [Thiobacillaceae bacterium]